MNMGSLQMTSRDQRTAGAIKMHTHSTRTQCTRQYLVTTIRNGEREEAVLMNSERARLDPNEVDVQIDEPKREIWIRINNNDGSRESHLANGVGFGAYEWDLLTDTVFSGGDIQPLKSDRAMNARVRRIRRLFNDSKDAERYIRTTSVPYGIGINIERIWRYIEVLAQ